MSCDITQGIGLLACKNVVGGYKAIYFANYNDYGFVRTSTAGAELINNLGTLSSVFKFDLKNDGNNFDEEVNGDANTYNTTATQTLTALLPKLSKNKQYLIKTLAMGHPIVFLELNQKDVDGNPVVLCLGQTRGCEVSSKFSLAGAINGANGYTLTIKGTEPEPAAVLNFGAGGIVYETFVALDDATQIVD